MWYKKLPQNYNFVCMTSFENGMCHYLGSRIYTSNLIFVAAIFLATRASHEWSQKTSTEFPACFLPRFLPALRLVEGNGRRRNASGILICTLCTLISIVGFSLVSQRSSNERRFQITFCTRSRPAVYLPQFFIDQLSFRRKKDLIGQCFRKYIL